MDHDKRRGEDPVPHNAEKMLNELQRLSLKRLEGYGWRLHFIRRPLFQEVVVVVIDSAGEKMGILEEDGSVDMSPAIKLRE
ncbi:hypothetical protein [Zhongshania arctica]|uniref:Uncharacterized protein n=1 Tax=Zhongshania arctica TaxID=3238302 RepID=A0ABV3TRV6_9GAMM